MARPFVVLFALYVAAFLPAEIACAQSVNGVISGTVVDQHHRSIARATLRVVDQLNATNQTTQTNDDGDFVFALLRPGKYTLSIEQSGLEKLEKRDILVLTADRLAVGTLILKIGSGTEVVQVTAETPAVQTTSSEQSAVVSSDELATLPVIGNDSVALTKIIPGSTYLGNGDNTLCGVSSQASFMDIPPASAAYFSTNGVFSSFSNYSWDDSPTVVANIQDVKVLVSGYEPEYGKALGAVLNVTTKSGAEGFHGSLWYSFRPQHPSAVSGKCRESGSNCSDDAELLNWFPAPNFTNTTVSKGSYNYVVPAISDNAVHQESVRLDYAPNVDTQLRVETYNTFNHPRGPASITLPYSIHLLETKSIQRWVGSLWMGGRESCSWRSAADSDRGTHLICAKGAFPLSLQGCEDLMKKCPPRGGPLVFFQE